MELTRCEYCEFNAPTDEMLTDINGRYICTVCAEQIREVSTTIKVFDISGTSEFLWSPQMGYRERSSYASVQSVPGITSSGEYEFVVAADGYKVIVSNWEISFGDERSKKFLVLMQKLTTRQLIPPMQIIVVMGQLGDLRMVINIVVKDVDSDKFSEWMKNSYQMLLN